MATRSIFFLVLLGLVAQQATAFSCYQCTSTVDSSNVETPTGNPCVEVGATTTQDAGLFGCQTTFTKSDGNLAATTGSYCTNTGSETTCYCSSDKCNSQKVTADRSYSCYSCVSSEYFDNGCGEKLDTSSAFVKTTVGCSACYKNVIVDGDMTIRYTRGCSRGIQVDDSCAGDVSEGTTKKCACKKSLCNSAESHVISFSTAIAAVLLSAFLKYFY